MTDGFAQRLYSTLFHPTAASGIGFMGGIEVKAGPGPGSRPGSWVLSWGPGSWVLGPGSWVLGPGSWSAQLILSIFCFPLFPSLGPLFRESLQRQFSQTPFRHLLDWNSIIWLKASINGANLSPHLPRPSERGIRLRRSRHLRFG